MHYEKFKKKHKIPSNAELGRRCGDSKQAISCRIRKYGYTDLEFLEFGDQSVLVFRNPETGRIIHRDYTHDK